HTPTASLSTTAALAVCVLVAVPVYGIASTGIGPYLHRYVEPTWVMLPFHMIGELTRTIALAIRLFGNTMSETMIVAVCLTIAPFFFPILMKILGLLTGLVQAYIFSILAALYIAAGISVQTKSEQSNQV
ncbi:MAG: F0F1 ATP synthase subunit A, partial [Candidatus Obscuribacterales bacterium]|nr:F0F1 ATP synthase subunit A [Candidatus Obscuribacterales bacterium]